MQYISYYQSPLGKILLAADQTGITGAWFENQKYYAHGLDAEHTEKETPVLNDAKRWLDLYFSGKEPDFMPPLHPSGTPFQREVWDILRQIPYGTTMTYGRGRAQPGLHPDPLPPRRRLQWKPDRICRRDGAENQTAGTGKSEG